MKQTIITLNRRWNFVKRLSRHHSCGSNPALFPYLWHTLPSRLFLSFFLRFLLLSYTLANRANWPIVQMARTSHTVGGAQLADNGCARALFGSVIRRLPAGAAPRCSAPRPHPHRFSCLASAACCCFLFFDSSKCVWGSRRHSAPHRPRLDPRHGYLALTVACLRFFRAAARLQSTCTYIYIYIYMYTYIYRYMYRYMYIYT